VRVAITEARNGVPDQIAGLMEQLIAAETLQAPAG
jgi:hypothetical protein